MPTEREAGLVTVLEAIAAMTGQELADAEADFRTTLAGTPRPDQDPADADEVTRFVARVKSRVGLAPALNTAERKQLQGKLDQVAASNGVQVTRGELDVLDALLRRTPEHVPTLDRAPVTFPGPLPPHLAAMWKTLLELDDLEWPWSLSAVR